MYSCPQDGCVRVFQRLSALEKHFSPEKCTQSLERHSLMDLAKMGYKTCLEEGVGVLPAIQAPIRHQEASLIPKEGWAIRAAKKSYRFSDKQKYYLMAKFHIGQWHEKCDEPAVLMVFVFFRHLNSFLVLLAGRVLLLSSECRSTSKRS